MRKRKAVSKRVKAYKMDWQRKYRKTFRGLISVMFGGMHNRCILGNCNAPELYLGKFVPDVQTFTTFALKSSVLKDLYEQWKLKHFELKFRPVPDRINPDLGYKLSNIRFVTYSDNNKISGRKSKKRR